MLRGAQGREGQRLYADGNADRLNDLFIRPEKVILHEEAYSIVQNYNFR